MLFLVAAGYWLTFGSSIRRGWSIGTRLLAFLTVAAVSPPFLCNRASLSVRSSGPFRSTSVTFISAGGFISGYGLPCCLSFLD